MGIEATLEIGWEKVQQTTPCPSEWPVCLDGFEMKKVSGKEAKARDKRMQQLGGW